MIWKFNQVYNASRQYSEHQREAPLPAPPFGACITWPCLSRQVITLGFQRPPLNMFCARLPDAVRRFNEIVIDFADPGSISIEFLAMIPGAELSLGRTKMTFSYKNSFATANALEGYERLILLAMAGEQSLFTRSDGLERLWEISAPLLDDPPPVEPYEPGSWGPPSTDRLIAPFRWHLPES